LIFQPRAKEDDVYTRSIYGCYSRCYRFYLVDQVLDQRSSTNAAAHALMGRVLMKKGDYAGAKRPLKVPTSGADATASGTDTWIILKQEITNADR